MKPTEQFARLLCQGYDVTADAERRGEWTPTDKNRFQQIQRSLAMVRQMSPGDFAAIPIGLPTRLEAGIFACDDSDDEPTVPTGHAANHDRRIDAALNAWTAHSIGLPVRTDSEGVQALQQLGFSLSVPEIELSLRKHEALPGRSAFAVRTGMARASAY